MIYYIIYLLHISLIVIQQQTYINSYLPYSYTACINSFLPYSYTADLSLNHVQRNVRVFVHSCIPLAEKNKAVLPEEICNHEPTQR